MIKVEIRDETYRLIYKDKFNMSDKNGWLKLIGVAEKFGFSIVSLIKDKLKIGEFF